MGAKVSPNVSPKQRLNLGLTLASKGTPAGSPKQRLNLGLTVALKGSPDPAPLGRQMWVRGPSVYV